jgi:hypothetical protein
MVLVLGILCGFAKLRGQGAVFWPFDLEGKVLSP